MATFDFEAGTVPSEFRLSASNPWAISTTLPYAGTYCLASPASTLDYEESQAQLIIDVTSAGTMDFRYAVHSESGADKLFFLIDGVEQFNASGSVAYTLFTSASLSVGTHILQWIYAKDESGSTGADNARIDDINLPAYTDHSGTLDGFESGISGDYSNGANPWAVDTGKSLFGSQSISSKVGLANSSTSEISITKTCAAGEMFFAEYISSERSYDYCHFYIDGAEELSAKRSGVYYASNDWQTCGWVFHVFTVTAASHTFKWTYSKDSGAGVGDDRARIDAVYIPLPAAGGATGKSNPLFGPLGGPLSGAIA